VRFSDTFAASKSEEDLDKLLEGLDKLTEELPDLVRSRQQKQQQATNGGICAAAQSVNIAAPLRQASAAAVNVNSAEVIKPAVAVAVDEDRGRRRERRQQPLGAERPLEYSNAHYFQVRRRTCDQTPLSKSYATGSNITEITNIKISCWSSSFFCFRKAITMRETKALPLGYL
jgi:hypothetical protein